MIMARQETCRTCGYWVEFEIEEAEPDCGEGRCRVGLCACDEVDDYMTRKCDKCLYWRDGDEV